MRKTTPTNILHFPPLRFLCFIGRRPTLLTPPNHVDHHSRRPFAAAGSLHTTRRQRLGDSTEAADATSLYLTNDGRHIRCKAVSGLVIGF